jgi:hypothetical protein
MRIQKGTSESQSTLADQNQPLAEPRPEGQNAGI